MRKAKYYRNMEDLDLIVEKEFLKKEPKAYGVLVALTMEQSDLSDLHMAQVMRMNIKTYKKWKAHLVMVGLLQVRQLNATNYFLSLGEDAIEQDDIMHEKKDYENLSMKALSSLSLIDEPNSESESFISNHYVSPEDQAMLDKIDREYPMPSTGDIVDSF